MLCLPSNFLGLFFGCFLGFPFRIKGLLILAHSESQAQQVMHGRGDDLHFAFASDGPADGLLLDQWIEAQGGHGWKVKGFQFGIARPSPQLVNSF